MVIFTRFPTQHNLLKRKNTVFLILVCYCVTRLCPGKQVPFAIHRFVIYKNALHSQRSLLVGQRGILAICPLVSVSGYSIMASPLARSLDTYCCMCGRHCFYRTETNSLPRAKTKSGKDEQGLHHSVPHNKNDATAALPPAPPAHRRRNNLRNNPNFKNCCSCTR